MQLLWCFIVCVKFNVTLCNALQERYSRHRRQKIMWHMALRVQQQHASSLQQTRTALGKVEGMNRVSACLKNLTAIKGGGACRSSCSMGATLACEVHGRTCTAHHLCVRPRPVAKAHLILTIARQDGRQRRDSHVVECNCRWVQRNCHRWMR